MLKSLLFIIILFSCNFTSQAQTIKTVGTGGNYTTLKAAFDAINAGTVSGSITLQIISSTTETSSAILNASGTGSSNYSSVNIYPTITGIIVTGNFNAALVDLNGSDNIVIDGSVNASGSVADLSFTNINTGTYAAAFRFINSAENNTIKYCTISSSCYSAGTGGISFGSSASGNGNDNNVIEYCNITNAGGNRPINLIFTSGTAGRENSGNSIRNNNIFDFFNAGTNSYGINISYNSIDWTISGNSFYETTTFIPSGSNSYSVIRTSTATNHTISGNYIGGSSAQCGGTAWTVNSSFGHYFYTIYISGGATTPVAVQNNIIKNINYTSTNNNPWDGIYISNGNVTVTGNSIGATTGTGSIVITTPNASANATISGGVVTAINLVGGGSGFTSAPLVTFSTSGSTTAATATSIISGGVVTGFNIVNGGTGYTSAPSVNINGAVYSTSHGIRDLSTATVSIFDNTIGSITTYGSNTYSHCFESIVISGAAATIDIKNNLIGSLTTANSIQTSSSASSSLYKQDLRGILINAVIPLSTLTGNIIDNLTSVYTGSNSSKLDGISILSNGGSNIIQNNIVRNLSADASSITVKGIEALTATTGTTQTVTGNTVYNLSNTHASASVIVRGIDFASTTTGTNIVSGNFVHSLSIASTNINSEIDGIVLNNGVKSCTNNIINLGAGITTGYKIYGIYDNSSGIVTNNNNVYFNTVYIAGTVASGNTSSTAALWNSNNNTIRNYKNNILANVRAGGTTGKHYAIRGSGTSGLTIDYNDYYVSGGGILGNISGVDKTTLALWKAATGQDDNSLETDPGFIDPGDTNPTDYVISATLNGISIPECTTDFLGITRAATPKMGALENNNNVWKGSTSTDFATASNWLGGEVPLAGADIIFDNNPDRSCYLDGNRIIGSITVNQSTDVLVLNGHQLTINGSLNLTNSAQLDATATSSVVVFSGSTAQSIPSGTFVSNTVDALSLNNSNGLTLNSDLTITQSLTLTNGTFSIGANTITLNGAIETTAGTLMGGSSSNIIFGGSNNTILPAVSLNNLTLNRTGGITLGGAVSVGGTLTLTSGTLTVAENTFTISGNSPVKTSGSIDASNVSATLIFANPAAIILPADIFTGSINNLTISDAGGVTAGSDMTVNGILNLSAANPSGTRGLLEMTRDYASYPGTTNTDYLDSYLLNMGASATTIGMGDVTGTVKRATIFANTPYTFGHQFTTVSLTAGTMPDDLSVTITIGSTLPGNPDAIKRSYEIISNGGSNCTVTANFHYLDSELQSSINPFYTNTESQMVTMDYDIGGGFGTPDEHGRSAYDFTNKFIGLSNIPISYFIKVDPGHNWRTVFTLRDFINGYYTWDGSTNSDWGTSTNWTPTGVPSDVSHVIIPDAATTPNDPVLAPNVTINTLTIQNGGVLIMGSETLTIKNSLSGGWEDQNILGNDPGTSTVIFSMPGTTISGNARFYNVEIADGADITNQSNSRMKIDNTISKSGSGKWYADLFGATIEYDGNNQTVLTTDAVPYYHNLVLSGTGTKTLPASVMTLHGDLILSGSVTATALTNITVNGNLIIENGSTFNTGNYNHQVEGNIDNSGTFNTAAGYGIIMNGTSAQSILGASSTDFDDLTINNSNGVGIYSNVNVNNVLSLTNGNLTIGDASFAINGTISQTDGLLDVSPVSSLVFGGTNAINLQNSLFTNPVSVKNITINNTGGVTVNTDIIVNNNLAVTSGRLEVQSGKSLTCSADFTNSSSGELVNNGNLYLNGNITNDQSSMTIGTGTLYLNGINEQTIAGSQKFNTNNLVTNNSAGIILNNNLSVSGTHTFTAGIITTSSTPNYLIYESGASYSGDGDDKHVNGWVKKSGSTDFVFPVGNAGYERTVALTALSENSEFNVKYNSTTTPNSSQLGFPLVYIDPTEYWTINKISGSAATVNLNWDNSKVLFPQILLTDIRAAYYDGSLWGNIGGTATGDILTTGSITSNSITDFNSNFTFGGVSYVLPIKIISFTAGKQNDNIKINWSISNEINVSHYELERSDDGVHYYSIFIQNPVNRNTTEAYSYFDRSILKGTVYYRLKVYELSNQVSYSRIVTVSGNGNSKDFYVITNPVEASIDIFAGDAVKGMYQYRIINTAGQTIQSGILDIKYAGTYSIYLNPAVSPGAYILVIQNESNSLNKTIIKK